MDILEKNLQNQVVYMAAGVYEFVVLCRDFDIHHPLAVLVNSSTPDWCIWLLLHSCRKSLYTPPSGRYLFHFLDDMR